MAATSPARPSTSAAARRWSERAALRPRTGVALVHDEPFGMGPRLGYRPELDGLRGLAIALVLAVHVGTVLAPRLEGFTEGGIVGVDVFFVLSGFLITSLLLQERRDTSRVSLRHFYAR